MTMTIFQEINLLSRTIQVSNHVTHEEETVITSKLSHLYFSLRMPAKQQYIVKEKKQNKTEKQLISEIDT